MPLLRSLCSPQSPSLFLLHAAPPVEPGLRGFNRVLLLDQQGETSANVRIGDMNGDGFPDLVLAKGRHWPLYNRVLFNDGKGHFTGHNLGDHPDRTYTAALADVNGDGHLDLLVSNDQPDRKLVYRNDGHVYLSVPGPTAILSGPPATSPLADLNGDGRPDIVVANRRSLPNHPASSFACFNDGKRNFPLCPRLPECTSA